MKILVTGLAGFTGFYVKAELEGAGHEVVGLSCDLLDVDAVIKEIVEQRPNAVIHLAAIAFVAHSNVQQIYDVNVVGTRNLLSALAQKCDELNSVVLASSANVYGSKTGMLAETEIFSPANDYAVSKVAMEYMAKTWQSRVPIVIARPFNYTGVGQDENFLIPKITSHFKQKRKVIELGNINVSRDFSDVRDVASAYRLLVERGERGEVYNISSGTPTSLKQVLDVCSNVTGHNIEIEVNPEFVRSNEIAVLVGDSSKLQTELGFMPKFGFSETLTSMLLN